MKKSTGAIIVILIMALAGFPINAQQDQSATSVCNRSCLINLVDAYLLALVKHEPERVPISRNARSVENIKTIHVGEGLWKTAAEVPGPFRIYVPDMVSQQVGFLGVMKESATIEDKQEIYPVLLALRLKLDNGEITEMEHLLVRNLEERNMVNLVTPRPGLLTTVPESKRMTHDELIRTGASYYDAVDENDGGMAPFADDCVRRENGVQTTSNPPPNEGNKGLALIGSMGCARQLDTHAMSYIDRIEDRRVQIADVDTGLVFGLSHFHHSMANKKIKVVGVPGFTERDMNFEPFDLPAAHIYKITDGKIHEIEAMGFVAPYNSGTGWE